MVYVEQLNLGCKEVSQSSSRRKICAFSTMLLCFLSQWEGTIQITVAIRRWKKTFKNLRVSIYFGTDSFILLSSGIIILSTFQLLALLLKQYLLVGSGFSKLLQYHKGRDDSFCVAQSQGIPGQNNPGSIGSCGWYFSSVILIHCLLFRRPFSSEMWFQKGPHTDKCILVLKLKVLGPGACYQVFRLHFFCSGEHHTCILSHSKDGGTQHTGQTAVSMKSLI